MEKFQALVEEVNTASEEKVFNVNQEKIECMVVSNRNDTPDYRIAIEQEFISNVDQFQCLSAKIADGRCTTEIKRRLDFTKFAFRKMSHLLTKSHLKMNTRNRKVKTHVLPTLLYGCEAWTVSK